GQRSVARVDFESATQVKAQMQNFGTAQAADTKFFVVEMLDGSTVESGRTQINAASTAPSTQPSWSTAMTDGAVFSANQVPNAFVNAASDASAAQDVYFSVALDDPQDG